MNDISLTAGMRNNLLSLKDSSRKTDETQKRLASGKKVNSPLDNATNFFAAKALGAKAADLRNLRDSIHQAIGTIQATSKGLEGVMTFLETMGGIVSAAAMTSDATEKKELAGSFDETYAQLNYLVNDSGYGGTNLLSNSSTDPREESADQLAVPLNAAGDAVYNIAGKFLGGGYVLHETPGGDPSWLPDDRGDTIAEYGVNLSVGNLSDVQLVIRFNPQMDTVGDVNHDGVLQAGEGTEIDFRLTNSSASTSTGISFSNTTISTGWSFLYNTNGLLADVAPGQSTITNMGTDLDLNIPAGTNGTQFFISTDFSADGVTKNLTFGPLTVGAITNGQTMSPSSISPNPTPVQVQTDAITINSADYSSGTFAVTLPGTPPVDTTFYAEKQGLQIFHSWLYDGFQSRSGIDAARSDIETAMSLVRGFAAQIGSHSSTLITRGEFNDSLAAVFETGADNLTLADMTEEGANLLMLQTRQSLSLQSLNLSSQAAQSVLKFFL